MQIEPKIYMAPLQGYTDRIYRTAYLNNFRGVDLVFTPFIMANNAKKINKLHLKDITVTSFQEKTIPQVLSKDADDFMTLEKYVKICGYNEMNWNLGCPFPMVAKKGRGSGLLPYPDKIDEILNRFFSESDIKLSIKCRIGYNDENEIFKIIPIFNKYPIKEIIIHPRTAKQLYKGIPNIPIFEKCYNQIEIPICYNGDINSVSDFEKMNNKFPNVNRWMLGRGLLSDPFLPSKIINGNIFSKEEKIEILKSFHNEILFEYKKYLQNDHNLLQKTKPFWFYLSKCFDDPHKVFKIIKKTQSEKEYINAVYTIFNS